MSILLFKYSLYSKLSYTQPLQHPAQHYAQSALVSEQQSQLKTQQPAQNWAQTAIQLLKACPSSAKCKSWIGGDSISETGGVIEAGNSISSSPILVNVNRCYLEHSSIHKRLFRYGGRIRCTVNYYTGVGRNVRVNLRAENWDP